MCKKSVSLLYTHFFCTKKEKIAIGKVNKFLKDNTLVHQPFVKDNGKSVADYLKSVDADLKVTEFRRVALG